MHDIQNNFFLVAILIEDENDLEANLDLLSVVTPVNVRVLKRLLEESSYDATET